MKFISKRAKINISVKHFYLIMSAIALMVIVNAYFLGASMTTKNLLTEVKRVGKSYSEVKWRLIGNYIAFSSVLAIFAIHTLLARYRVKVGYIYTNIWNVLIASIIAIPIVLSPNFSDYKTWVNIGLYFLFLFSMFYIYKEIYELRRMRGYWTKSNGGLEW